MAFGVVPSELAGNSEDLLDRAAGKNLPPARPHSYRQQHALSSDPWTESALSGNGVVRVCRQACCRLTSCSAPSASPPQPSPPGNREAKPREAHLFVSLLVSLRLRAAKRSAPLPASSGPRRWRRNQAAGNEGHEFCKANSEELFMETATPCNTMPAAAPQPVSAAWS